MPNRYCLANALTAPKTKRRDWKRFGDRGYPVIFVVRCHELCNQQKQGISAQLKELIVSRILGLFEMKELTSFFEVSSKEICRTKNEVFFFVFAMANQDNQHRYLWMRNISEFSICKDPSYEITRFHLAPTDCPSTNRPRSTLTSASPSELYGAQWCPSAE